MLSDRGLETDVAEDDDIKEEWLTPEGWLELSLGVSDCLACASSNCCRRGDKVSGQLHCSEHIQASNT